MGYSVPDSPESRERVAKAIDGCLEALDGITYGEALVVLESLEQAFALMIKGTKKDGE